MSFTSIPMLDLAAADDPQTKLAFLADLRDALMEVGFLYIKNTGIPDKLFRNVSGECRAFFDLPLAEKLKIEMKKVPSFLGYSRVSAEITAGLADAREQLDLSTEHALPAPGAPRHHSLRAPNQWPALAALPGFRPAFSEYMRRMADVSIRFTRLVAEAIGLPSDAFHPYFDPPGVQQHKLKVVRYPDMAELAAAAAAAAAPPPTRQGVGPHKDSMLISYLLQASEHCGLQAQNMRGEWVDCPPVDGTLVVVVGQGLEALTQGVCTSTTHRVLSPAAGQGPRFSIPFFQGVRGDATFAELVRAGVGPVPEAVTAQRRRTLEANGGRLHDLVDFTFRFDGPSITLGDATLRNRVKSHPDVAEAWYPDILAQIRQEEAERETWARRPEQVPASCPSLSPVVN